MRVWSTDAAVFLRKSIGAVERGGVESDGSSLSASERCRAKRKQEKRRGSSSRLRPAADASSKKACRKPDKGTAPAGVSESPDSNSPKERKNKKSYSTQHL